jgi:hypothetical protein
MGNDAYEHAARICEGVVAQSRNSLFRSAAKICAALIRDEAQKQAGGNVKHTASVYNIWFSDEGLATITLPKDADVIFARDCSIANGCEIHVIEHADEVRMDPRKFHLVRPNEPMPTCVGSGDRVSSFVHCSGEVWHIFAGQYDRGVMTKEMPAQHRAITKLQTND